MTTFYLDGQAFESREGESVLDTLIRHGQRVNYSCKKGVCKTCLLQHVEGEMAVGAQRGLTLGLKQRHYLCSCLCQPTQSLRLKSILPQDLFIGARIQDKQFINDAIVKVVLKPDEALRHRPGQYINLRRFDGLTRSYSPTNVPDGPLIELHVRRKYNGQFSDWLYHHAGVGETLLIQGPLGRSYYRNAYSGGKLIIIAYGSGLGVAHAILNQALAQDHQGEIFLYVGARDDDDLYLHPQLLKMSLEHRQLSYQACITGQVESQGRRVIHANPFAEALKSHEFDRQQHLFLCGEPGLVNQSRETAFLNGFPIERIHTLSFEYKDLRARPRD